MIFERANILLIGDKGVNKSLIAKTIYQYSNKHKQTFILVDCNTISDCFFDKILTQPDNVFLKAKNGTLFFKNLDKTPLESREKLLTLLENKITADKYHSDNNLPRFISSISQQVANTNLSKLCTLLGAQILKIPALKNHKDDIFELFNIYMSQAAGHYQVSIPELSEQDIITLSSFDWPGNQH